MSGARGVNCVLLPCVCLLIVAAFQAYPAAASAVSEDVPVPGGVAALAQSLAIHPAPDRGRFMFEVTRLVYEFSEVRSPAVAAFLQQVRQSSRNRTPLALSSADNGSDLVPVPLTADVWSDAIFHRRVPREALVLAIVADREASWLCHGLASLDDETLAFFGSHPSLLSRLHERSAPLFAAFAGSLRVHDNRIVPPGDADAVPLWEAIVGEKVTRPDRFVQILFEASDGRMAYLFDTIAQLDPAHRAFALGAWMPAAARVERFKALSAVVAGSIREWHVRTLPFGRSSFDLGMALMRLRVEDDGAPAAIAARGFWTRVFVGGPESADDTPIDAAWLAENVVATDVRQRSERLDQLGLVQRVFGDQTGDRAAVVFLARSMPRFRALMLTFERAGIRNPSTYAAVVRHAAKLSGMEGRRGYVAQAQLQGALVLVTRLVAVGTWDVATAERVIDQLVAVPVESSGYAGGIARWLRDVVHPALPPARNVENATIAGLAGSVAPDGEAVRVTWEGQAYRLDLAAAERNRLRRVRDKQQAPAIDLPLQMADAAHLLATEKASVDDLQDIASQFTALAADLRPRSREEDADNVPAGVSPLASPHDVLRKAAEELTKAVRNKDLKRAPRIAEPIVEAADDLLARNLLSFSYAISLGDPEGTVLLADDVSHRHDFGFGVKDAEMRARQVWSVPRQEVAPGVPWHVSGSLLALDVALSTLQLRRVATDHVLEPPKLTSNARDTFATSVALMDPYALRDADRDAIAGGIEGGRRRVLMATDAARLDGIADELSMEGARRRALRWTLAREPDRVMSMLSTTELLALGGAKTSDLQAWGMTVLPASGCLCSHIVPPGAWSALAGRPQLGLGAWLLPDLNFRVAMVLKELGLPSPLAKVVLSAAMQDFIDEARPTDDSDWLSLARAARAVPRERIEDYVAAATATGPLVPDGGRSRQREP